LSGKINSGKNEFAKQLAKQFKSKGHTVGFDLFAKGVKDGCKEDFKQFSIILNELANQLKNKISNRLPEDCLNIHKNDIENVNDFIDKELTINDDKWYEDKNTITRTLLQIYGTNIFRNRVSDNYWVNQTRERVLNSDDDITILTDCRFPNEILGFKNKNLEVDWNYKTFIIRIERDIKTNKNIKNHDSETALDEWDNWNYIIKNNGTIDNLRKIAKSTANNIVLDFE
jgi:hypothetical protein